MGRRPAPVISGYISFGEAKKSIGNRFNPYDKKYSEFTKSIDGYNYFSSTEFERIKNNFTKRKFEDTENVLPKDYVPLKDAQEEIGGYIDITRKNWRHRSAVEIIDGVECISRKNLDEIKNNTYGQEKIVSDGQGGFKKYISMELASKILGYSDTTIKKKAGEIGIEFVKFDKLMILESDVKKFSEKFSKKPVNEEFKNTYKDVAEKTGYAPGTLRHMKSDGKIPDNMFKKIGKRVYFSSDVFGIIGKNPYQDKTELTDGKLYTLKELSKRLGIHYTDTSKLVKEYGEKMV